jgi:hypothetical protein
MKVEEKSSFKALVSAANWAAEDAEAMDWKKEWNGMVECKGHS